MESGVRPDGPTESLRLGYFTRSLVAAAARDRGLFAAQGLDVLDVPCRSSAAQFASLRAGEYDLVVTSPDNVANYRLSEANALGGRLDARILLAIDAGLGLSVLAAPDVRGLSDLKGRSVGVDVAASGFAMALYAVLERAGLRARDDVEIVELGSTPRRREALLAGACDATLLYAGHDLIAEAAGFRRLARVTDHLHPYLGAVLAGTGEWLSGHADQARRFVTAWRGATALVRDPAERDYVEHLITEVLELPRSAAAGMRSVFLSERDGLIADGVVDPAALRTVLRTRAEFGPGGAPAELTDAAIAASGLVDARFVGGKQAL